MPSGAEILLEITDLAYGGDGVGRHDGRVIFVPFTIPGETVRVRLTHVRRQWARAAVVSIEVPSPDRVAAPCPWFGRCGGCAYQHVAYPRQLEIKTMQVGAALRRIGKFSEPPVEPALPSPHVYGYRNRITVHVDPPRIGFRGTDPRQVIDVEKCLLADDAVNAALRRLRSRKSWRPGPATLRNDPHQRGFRQVNDAAAEVLAGVVVEMAGRGENLVDAYCGAGFFAKKLTGQFRRVIGIDWDERSLAAAQADEGGAAVEYVAGDTAAVLPGVLEQAPAAVVLLDPPAQGLAPAVIETLRAARPPRLVYVSCDPATLSRDLARLAEVYDLRRAVPVDMFPQTASIETVCWLERKESLGAL
jgi:tRNA/tmRNA/rRNA uracil-C5-methylase (TrmA/RlmC/RlmD family)